MENAIMNVVDIVYLTDDNAVFYKKGDFPALKLKSADADGDGYEDKGIVTLRRMFPFDEPYTMISVLDEREEEIGIIRDINEFSSADFLKEELEKIYFMPIIKSIRSMKERFGYSNFKTVTDRGNLEFTVNDIYKSMLKKGAGVIITDVDGNRYAIPDVSALDKKSYRMIELYM